MRSFCFLIALLVVNLHPVVLSESSYVALPLANCPLSDSNLPISSWNSRCPGYCPSVGEMTMYRMSILSLPSEEANPSVLYCSKVKISQSFEELWTFSKIVHSPIHESLPITYPEALSFIIANCPNYRCQFRPDGSIPEEWHWASTTTREKMVVYCDNAHATAFLSNGQAVIKLPGPILTPASSGYYQPSDHLGIYIWNQTAMNTSGCNFIAGPVMECYSPTSQPNVNLNCPNEGIFLGNVTEYPGARCSWMVLLSSTGFLVGWQYLATGNNTVLTSLENYTDARMLSLAGDMNRILTAMRYNECLDRCMMEGLAFQRMRNNGKGWFLFQHKMVIYDSNNYSLCRPMYGCKIANHSTYCPEKDAIEVHCGAERYWWNISSPVISDEMTCHRAGMLPKILNMTVRGFQTYLHVTSSGDILTVPQSSDQMSYYYPDPLTLSRMNSLIPYEDIISISSFLNETLIRTSMIPLVTNTTVTTENVVMDSIEAIKSFVQDYYKGIVLVICILAAVIFCYYISLIILSLCGRVPLPSRSRPIIEEREIVEESIPLRRA